MNLLYIHGVLGGISCTLGLGHGREPQLVLQSFGAFVVCLYVL